jgi:hypothetical protein
MLSEISAENEAAFALKAASLPSGNARLRK